MKCKPLVSVVIPNYNHSLFLKRRIESVLNQTYSNFNIYILDDHSKDKSEEIIQEYANHPKIKTVDINRKNSGSVFIQWVKGIKLAEGKYLWIAESDDYAHERFLEETVTLAEQKDDIGFVFTDSHNVDRNEKLKGTISKNHFFLKKTTEKNQIFDDKEKAPLLFVSNILIPNASAVLFNLNLLKKAVNLNEIQSYKNVGDQFAYLSIYLKFKIGFVNIPLNYRRIHKKNTTSRNYASGLLHKEQIHLINYFLSEIKGLNTSKPAFNYYLRKNFLKVTDFFFLLEMRSLLKKLYLANLISPTKYFYLRGYVMICIFSSKKPPLIIRKKIKGVLQN